MKFPRNISGNELIKSLQKLGYVVTRQKGSHVRMTSSTPTGDHHITIPNHNPLKGWHVFSNSRRGCNRTKDYEGRINKPTFRINYES